MSRDETPPMLTKDAATMLGISEASFRRIAEKHGISPDDEKRRYGGGTYFLWSARTVRRIARLADSQKAIARKKQEKPAPANVDLLAAIFAVNRAAKRHRDAAQSHYRGRRHGLSGSARQRKEYLYSLKDLGIAAAYQEGRLQFVGTHGALALYAGEGYRFHSGLVPINESSVMMLDEERFFAEAKPRERHEPTQRDATHTLQQRSPVPMDQFRRIEIPRQQRVQRAPDSRHDDDLDEDC